MIQKVNPKTAMYESLHVTADVLTPEKIYLLKLFLEKNYKGEIAIIEAMGKPDAATFRYNQQSHMVKVDQYIVRERKTGAIEILFANDYHKLFGVYPSPADNELKRLSDYIQKDYTTFIGMPVGLNGSDGKLDNPVSIAIHVLSEARQFLSPISIVSTAKARGIEPDDTVFNVQTDD